MLLTSVRVLPTNRGSWDFFSLYRIGPNCTIDLAGWREAARLADQRADPAAAMWAPAGGTGRGECVDSAEAGPGE